MRILLTAFTAIFFFLTHCNAQNKYTFKLRVLGVYEGLSVSIDNGIQPVEIVVKDSITELSDFYVSNYTSIEIFFPQKNNQPPAHSLNFFIDTLKAEVFIENYPEQDKILLLKNNINAVPFKDMGASDLDNYTQMAFDTFWTFYNQNLQFLGSNDSITEKTFAYRFEYVSALNEAIKEFSPSYYSFWQFRRQISNEPNIDRLEKELTLEVKFKEFEGTYEYQMVKELIFGSRIAEGDQLNDFMLNDFITGTTQRLREVKGQKLIISWATWCAPCIKKLNTINDFLSDYPDLFVIYINNDSKRERAENFINKKNLRGVHLSSQDQSIPISLSNQVIPKVYLIDANNYIIYSSDSDESPESNRFETILKEVYIRN